MNFGTDTVFDYVRTMITDPESDDAYQKLYYIVSNDCFVFLHSCSLSTEDKEDIMQSVQISVYAGLHGYVRNFQNASVQQRNAYLRTIIRRRLNDLLARKYRHQHVASYDADDFPAELCGDQADLFTELSNRSELLATLEMLCASHFAPAQIIAYLLGRCTIASGKNAKPALVAQRLQALPLLEAAGIAIGQFRHNCPFPIEDDIFAPLLQRLVRKPAGHECFDLTPRQISDANSMIAAYLRKQRDLSNGGDSL